MSGEPTTVGALIKRMRAMLGHLKARDRRTVLEAIEAMLELSTRLYEATHVPPKAPAFTLTPVPDDDPAPPAEATP